MEPGPLPEGVTTTVTTVKTADGAAAPGVLYAVEGSETVAAFMHPRQDLARHYLIPILLEAGYSVWAQSSRVPNNDLTLIHEEAVLDAAAGFSFLAEQGYTHLVAIGPSGGATLYAFYVQQATVAPEQRIVKTPGGKPTGLDTAQLPLPRASCWPAASIPRWRSRTIRCPAWPSSTCSKKPTASARLRRARATPLSS